MLKKNKKMNTNKIFKTLSLGLVLGLATACTSGFEEANRPGDKASGEELSRDNYNTGSFLIQMQNEAFPEQ